jgi:hypothetical protein
MRETPTGPQQEEADVLTERDRIDRLSRVRDLVFGSLDGLIVPLGVVSGVAGGIGDSRAVIVAGIAEAFAGALSMGAGEFIAGRSEAQVQQTEVRKELAEMRDAPKYEFDELVRIYEQEGMGPEDATRCRRAESGSCSGGGRRGRGRPAKAGVSGTCQGRAHYVLDETRSHHGAAGRRQVHASPGGDPAGDDPSAVYATSTRVGTRAIANQDETAVTVRPLRGASPARQVPFEPLDDIGAAHCQHSLGAERGRRERCIWCELNLV